MKRNLYIVLAGFLLLVPAHSSYAGEIDILVDKLVEKGVLTPVEARIILDETKAEVAKQISEGTNEALPKWIQTMKLKGDFRLRYQYERKGKEIQSRSRGRIRYRLGLESKVNDQVKVGAGLASGSDDPRSTNQSFENSFDTPDIRLEAAYVEYEPADWAKVIGGKFVKNEYLWTPTDMMWDTDVNPEGGSVHFAKSLKDGVDGYINTGVWVLEELESSNTAIAIDGSENNVDPFMSYVQTGLNWEKDKLDSSLAAAYYSFYGVQGIDFPHSRDTNTKQSGSPGFLTYDYDAFGFSGEMGISNPFELPVERVAVFADYIQNIDPSEQDMGWAAGIKFGHKKVSKKGNWQGKYQYVWLGKDAVLDIFPDSDRLGGDTNVKSHEAIMEYALKDNIVLGLDYYYTDKIKGASQTTDEHLLQTDLMLKF